MLLFTAILFYLETVWLWTAILFYFETVWLWNVLLFIIPVSFCSIHCSIMFLIYRWWFGGSMAGLYPISSCWTLHGDFIYFIWYCLYPFRLDLSIVPIICFFSYSDVELVDVVGCFFFFSNFLLTLHGDLFWYCFTMF